MDFKTAEEKFQELQARIRRGEALSEDQYQEELAKLMVQDESGIFWSLEPGTGRWLYFNGTEWVPGTPPKKETPAERYTPVAAVPPVERGPTYESPAVAEPEPEMPPAYAPAEPATPMTTGFEQPSDTYSFGTPSASYMPPGATQPPDVEPMPTYVRMPEPEPAPGASGGIPPRPVREASPLGMPGGERAWLPFAFGALVLLLCAVVLFFGVRNLPQLTGTAQVQPTEQPTETEIAVLPTETVELQPTEEQQPTEEPQATPVPQPTAGPKQVTATTTDVLNIRQGPARTTTAIGKLPSGTTVTVVGRNADGSWLQIQIPEKDQLGWVSADFVTVEGDVNSLPVVEASAQPKPQVTETPAG